ncbi:MAG: M3 family metallopeptidase [Myxococcota bacterium]|nr:M3 family metallopeptidase [Myxococcota bacterium]
MSKVEDQEKNDINEQIIWLTVEKVSSFCERHLAFAREKRDQLHDNSYQDSHDALHDFNALLLALDEARGYSGLLSQVHPDGGLRAAAEESERKLQEFSTEINLDRKLFEAISKVDVENEEQETKRFVEKILLGFRRAGVDKDESVRKRLKEIRARLVQLGQDFSRTIREDVRSVELDTVEKLAGMPADWIKAHPPDENGRIKITTNYPDYLPVQNYAEDETLRKELTRQFLSRGFPENVQTLRDILTLRKEYAELLGFENWADYNATDKMAKTGATIATFIEDIAEIAKPKSTDDVAQILKRKKADVPDAEHVELWDRFFYVGKVKQEEYGFDAQSVRPYFEYARVTKGIMDLYGELFGIRFTKNETTPVWHESVHAYDVHDDSGERIAEFFLDMHPREGKFKHAAMFPLVTGVSGGKIPAASLVCNFPEPKEGEPALLEHGQVVTYFHEFGHLIHQLLATDSKWANLAGISVEWDFVEVPSQLLEEWAWDPGVLARFAHHHETNEAIPSDLVERMKKSSEFGKGAHLMRQVFLTALSYGYHVEDPAALDLLGYQKQLEAKFMPYPHVEGTHTYASFGHLNGYSSMYYTYQWSLVIAKDIFTRFQEAGILDRQVAEDYWKSILRPGGSKQATDLIQDFLGRPFNLDAYQKWLEG